jgi:hypothetical protein
MHTMLRGCLTTALLLLSALLLTAIQGRCAEPNNIEQQIAERTKQYQESLRQRASQLSPSLQAKIELQARQTVADGLAQWKSGKINVQLALPGRAETQRLAQFAARHLPFSGVPEGAWGFGINGSSAVLTVTSVQQILKTLTVSIADSAVIRSLCVGSPRHGIGISYFIRIVCTIVQRQ